MAEKEKRESMSVSLPRDLAHTLKTEAEIRMVGVSFLAEKAIRAYLAKLPPIQNVEE